MASEHRYRTSRPPGQVDSIAQDHVSNCQFQDLFCFQNCYFLEQHSEYLYTVYGTHKLSNVCVICQSDSPLAADRATKAGVSLVVTVNQLVTAPLPPTAAHARPCHELSPTRFSAAAPPVVAVHSISGDLFKAVRSLGWD